MSDPAKPPHAAMFEPYFIAIGKVANAYSQLEFSMNDAIWELANVERAAGVCMTAQMIGPGPRNRCLLALLKFRKAPQKIIEEFNKIGNKIEGLAARRNRFVHDPFVLEQETGQIARMEATADKHVSYGFMGTDVAKLTELAIEIDYAANEFDQLYLRACAELPAWPRTQFKRSWGIAVSRTDQRTSEKVPPHQPAPSRE